MSEVVRLSDETLSDLNIFHTLYINDLKEHANESALARTLLQDHLNYSLSSQVGFAIRYAANTLSSEFLSSHSDS